MNSPGTVPPYTAPLLCECGQLLQMEMERDKMQCANCQQQEAKNRTGYRRAKIHRILSTYVPGFAS